MIEKPYDQLGFLLMQTSLLKQRQVNSALREYGITYIQFVILAGILELGNTGKEVTQQVLVTERRLDKAMVSVVVKSLINRKLIVRTNHPDDSRSRVLNLTAEGRKLAKIGIETSKNIDNIFFEGVDKEEFCNLLNKLLTQNS